MRQTALSVSLDEILTSLTLSLSCSFKTATKGSTNLLSFDASSFFFPSILPKSSSPFVTDLNDFSLNCGVEDVQKLSTGSSKIKTFMFLDL